MNIRTHGWLLGCLLAAGGLRADTITWTNRAGGVFANAANWSPSQVPDAEDGTVFNAEGAAAYTVVFNTWASNKTVQVVDDRVVWRLDGQTYTALGDVTIATAPDGHLTITGGTFRLPLAGSDLVVPGSGLHTGSLVIAGSGTTLDMAGGDWLDVVGGDRGSLLIRDATVKNAKGFDLGGRVTVDGGLVTNILSWANVGRDGPATVVVTNSGRLYLPGHTIGHSHSGNLIVVDGSNSLFQSGSIQFATGGSATAITTNGGTLRCNGAFYLGYASTIPYTGAVVVAKGSLLHIVNAQLYLGGSSVPKLGRGHLTVLEGGSVVCDKNLYIWTNSMMRIAGGSFSVPNYNGILLNGGTIEGHGAFTIPSGGTYLNNNGGLVRATGSLVFGSYQYNQDAAGRVEFVLGGREAGKYGRIALTGTPAACTMKLAGTCAVTLAPGIRLRDKDTFDLLDWGASLSGTFDKLELPALRGGNWITNELYTTGRISVHIPSGTLINIR